MPLEAFDHVNVYTTELDRLTEWYQEVLGLHSGWRPPFRFPGAWLYLGDQAIVHLVGVEAERDAPKPRIEHFAFRASGMAEFLALLKARDIAYTLDPVAGLEIVQVNIRDPDGNRVHIDFASREADGLS